MEIITKNDLPSALQSHELVEVMLAGANAKALRVAPCLADSPSNEALAEARLVLVGAVKRWVEAGSGAFQQQTAGPFSVSTDTRQRTGFALWPSEITALQDVCSTATSGASAFSFRPSGSSARHADVCSLAFGATYCSCGSDINNYKAPLYEGGILTSGDA